MIKFLELFTRWPGMKKISPAATPSGTTDVVMHTNYGQKFRQTFRGRPGVTSEEVAREFIRNSGNWFDIGGGKFANVQDIREISLEKKN
jgi:hypothetical protein